MFLLWAISVRFETTYIIRKILDKHLFRLLGSLISTQVPDNRSYLLQNTGKLLPKFVTIIFYSK